MIIVLKSTKTWTFSWKSCMSFSSKQPKHKHFYEKVTWNCHQINKIMNFFMKKFHYNCPQINKIMNFFMKKFHDIVLKSTKTWNFYEKVAWYCPQVAWYCPQRARNNFIIDFLRKKHMILPSNRPKRKQFDEKVIW